MNPLFMCILAAMAVFTLVGSLDSDLPQAANAIVPEMLQAPSTEVTPIPEEAKVAAFTEDAQSMGDECSVTDADGDKVPRPGDRCAPAGKCGFLMDDHILPMLARRSAEIKMLGGEFCRWDCELGHFQGDFKVYEGKAKCCYPGPYVLARNFGVTVTGRFAGHAARSTMRLYEVGVTIGYETSQHIKIVRSNAPSSHSIQEVLHVYVDGKRTVKDFRDSLIDVKFDNGKAVRSGMKGGNTGHLTIEVSAGNGEFVLHLTSNQFFAKQWWVNGSQQQGGDMRLMLTSSIPTTTSSFCGMLLSNPTQEQLRKLRQVKAPASAPART